MSVPKDSPRIIILFANNKKLQSIFEQYSRNFEQMKNDPQHHWRISKTRIKETEILKKIGTSTETLQALMDKISEIDHKIFNFNKDISLKNQLILQSKKMLKNAQDEYTESLIYDNKEHTGSIENKLKKYQHNLDITQAEIPAIHKAINKLEAILESLKKLTTQVEIRITRKEISSIKEEYVQHLNKFKEHLHAYLNTINHEKYRYHSENKYDTDLEIYKTLELNL